MENEEHLSIEEIFFRATAIFGFQPKVKSFNWIRLFEIFSWPMLIFTEV